MHELRTYIKGLLNIWDILRSNFLDRPKVSSSVESNWVVGGVIPEMARQIQPMR